MGNVLEYLLKLNAGAFNGPLEKARSSQAGFIREGRGMSANSSQVQGLGNAFGGLAMKIGGAFAAYKAGMSLFSAAKGSLDLAADMESTNISFRVLVGNALEAGNVLMKIKQIGAETPFEFPELAESGKLLIAFGEAADNVPNVIRRIGDVASGVNAPLNELSEIYGKARVAGTLFSEDINQLTGRGIPVIQEFAKILKVSEGEVKGLASEGKITFPMLEQAFINLTSEGGRFFGMMQQQAESNKGLTSTLADGFNELKLAFGTPLNDALKPVLKDAIGLVNDLQPMAKTLGSTVAEAVTAMRNFVKDAGSGSGVVIALGAKLKAAFMDVVDVAMIPFRVMAAGVPPLGSALMTVFMAVGDALYYRLQAGALAFGAMMKREVAQVLAAMPLGMGKDASAQMSQSADFTDKQAAAAGNVANEAGKLLPLALRDAATQVGVAVQEMKSKMTAEISKFKLPEASAPAEAGISPDAMFKEVDQIRADDAKAKADADAYMKSLETPAAPTVAAKPADKPGVKVSLGKALLPTDTGTGAEPEAEAETGGRKIRSLRDGSTRAIQRRGFGTLANPSGILSPKVTPPGQGRNQDERREASAKASRSGGGNEKQRWDAVVAIQKHFEQLAVA